MATLVVGGDGNIDVLGGRVTVAEGLQLLAHVQFLTDPQFGTYNDGDVDVGGLLDGLGVGAGVGDDDQAGLLERAGDVVGEVTGGEATGNGDGTGVGGELQDGTLTVGTGRDDTDCAVLARLVCGLHCFCCCCCVRARWRLAHLAMADAQAALAAAAAVARRLLLSAGLSMAAMIRAARTIFSQVLPTFRTLTPSALVFHR